jgi:hypothetical protein
MGLGTIEQASREATLAAFSIMSTERLRDQHDYQPSIVTFQAVAEAQEQALRQGNERSPRPIIQKLIYKVVYHQLHEQDSHDANPLGVLEEAAYQLLISLRNPEALDMCYLAIVTVLYALRADLKPNPTALR